MVICCRPIDQRNSASTANQKMYGVFYTKIRTRGSRCRVGYLIAVGDFTSDAKLQATKFAIDNITIVFIGRVEAGAWIEHAEPATYIDELVTDTVLN